MVLQEKVKQAQAGLFVLKLHLVINNSCEIFSLKIKRGNTENRTTLPELCNVEGIIEVAFPSLELHF